MSFTLPLLPGSQIRCERYRCTLTAERCVERQLAVRIVRITSTRVAKFEYCHASCHEGVEIRAALKGKLTETVKVFDTAKEHEQFKPKPPTKAEEPAQPKARKKRAPLSPEQRQNIADGRRLQLAAKRGEEAELSATPVDLASAEAIARQHRAGVRR